VGHLIDGIRAMEECHRARELVLALSPREREVLALVAAGERNREIAAALQISEFTVKRHVQNILHRLRLPSRRDAATLYRAAGGTPTATAVEAVARAAAG
jgi:DNA-binding CsgD family transcriptional regulator